MSRSNSYEASLDVPAEELPEVEYTVVEGNSDAVDGDVGRESEILVQRPARSTSLQVHELLLKVFNQLNGESDDTVLTPDELHEHFTLAALEHELPELLPMLDTDGDGVVTPAEILAQLDGNGDGAITILEFTQHMQRLLAKHDPLGIEVSLVNDDLYTDVGDMDA